MPTFNRNTIVFVNNKRQNIEYRLFANPDGTLNTCSVAIGFSSFYSKLNSDRNTVSSNLSVNYFVSQSNATGSTISYQNNKPIFSELLDILFLEYASTGSFKETGSFTNSLSTRYFISESNSTGSTITYQNNKAVFTEDSNYIVNEFGSFTILIETGSFANTLSTRYYISESNATGSIITYQNNKPIYAEDLSYFVNEFGSFAIFIETGSFSNTLSTNYYISESNATGSTISYQNSKYVILEDSSYLLTE